MVFKKTYLLSLVISIICCSTSKNIIAEQSILIAIAGGSGSGKTTFTNNIQSTSNDIIVISQDSYYKDLSHLKRHERDKVNFDHPNSVDFDLLGKHLDALRNGNSIQKPRYDFKTHSRSGYSLVTPKRIILIEGILILTIPKIISKFDIKLYIDTDHDIRVLRRIKRDIEQRGRTLDSVYEQYIKTVQPMFLKYVEPSKRYADLIIPKGGDNKISLEVIISLLKQKLTP